MNRSDRATSTELLEQVRCLLVDALDLLDRTNATGLIGARLQHVIDDLDRDLRSESRR